MIVLAGSAIGQPCERMTVKNASGQIVSDSLMCMGDDGVWVNAPPAETHAQGTQEPVKLEPAIAPPPEPDTVAAPLPSEPVEAATAPVSVPAAAPETEPFVTETVEATPAPIPLEPVAVVSPLEPALPDATDPNETSFSAVEPIALSPVSEPVPIENPPLTAAEPPAPAESPVETVTRSAPAGDSQRQEAYAKLGLVCEAKEAVFCSGDCTGKCEGKSGWCDGRSGKIYPSLEAIERRHCRRR